MLSIEEYEIAKNFLERHNHMVDKKHMNDEEFRVLNKMMTELWTARLIEWQPEKNQKWSNVESARPKPLSDEEYKEVVKKRVGEFKT